MKAPRSLWALILVALILTSCGPSSQINQANVLDYAIENDLTTLDPCHIIDVYSIQVIGQMLEGLVSLDGKNRLIPVLAESWSNDADFRTWTFKIRKGVLFHENECFGKARTRELLAEDVRYSFERLLEKTSYPSFMLVDVEGAADFQSGKSKSVSGLKALDSRTFQVKLREPEPHFLFRLTSPWMSICPREAVETRDFGRALAPGTGPFKLVKRQDTDVVVEKNDAYWRKVEGNLDQVHFRVIKNEQICLSELRNHNISLMRVLLVLMPGLIKSDGNGNFVLNPPFDRDFQVASFPTFNTHCVGFNCDKLDVHLRRAMSLAINRKDVVQTIAHNSGIATAGTVPVGLQGYEPPYSGDISNLELARNELKKSSWDLSKPIELLVHEKNQSEQEGQLFQDQMKKIGLQIVLHKVDFNAVVDRMIKGQTEAVSMWFNYVFSAPEPTLEIFMSSKIPVPNFFHYRSDRYDQLLSRAIQCSNRQEANKLSRDAERQLIDDAPLAFLYQLKDMIIFRKDISNLSCNGHGVPLLWDAAMAPR